MVLHQPACNSVRLSVDSSCYKKPLQTYCTPYTCSYFGGKIQFKFQTRPRICQQQSRPASGCEGVASQAAGGQSMTSASTSYGRTETDEDFSLRRIRRRFAGSSVEVSTSTSEPVIMNTSFKARQEQKERPWPTLSATTTHLHTTVHNRGTQWHAATTNNSST